MLNTKKSTVQKQWNHTFQDFELSILKSIQGHAILHPKCPKRWLQRDVTIALNPSWNKNECMISTLLCSFAVESYMHVCSSTNQPCPRLHAGHWGDGNEQGGHDPALLELSRSHPTLLYWKTGGQRILQQQKQAITLKISIQWALIGISLNKTYQWATGTRKGAQHHYH